MRMHVQPSRLWNQIGRNASCRSGSAHTTGDNGAFHLAPKPELRAGNGVTLEPNTFQLEGWKGKMDAEQSQLITAHYVLVGRERTTTTCLRVDAARRCQSGSTVMTDKQDGV